MNRQPKMRRRFSAIAIMRIGASVGAAAAATVAVLVAIAKLDANRATTVSLALLAALAFAVASAVPDDAFVNALNKVSVLKVAGLHVELKQFIAQTDVKGDEDVARVHEGDQEYSQTLVDLKIRLEAKLTYLAKHVLCADPNYTVPTFLTIGSLATDGYLSRDQAKLAYEIMGLREYDFERATAAETYILLQGGNKFVDTLRAEVFEGFITAETRKSGWTVARVTDTPRGRRDLMVTDKIQSLTHHVIPVFSLEKDSPLLEKARKRLQDNARASGPGLRLIVVPPRSKAAKSDLDHAATAQVSVVDVATYFRLLGIPRP
ncbi:hypothetical protein [Mycobacterium vicinigordonae]|uniref:Restriction endonuclease type IV Mrr domain-containing protein n=1 Tax=Mycobacterium vicinigordonae TaxID=1719132 RepID=A0A7D6DV30_9MYCO|nr:hypothetical protein [Mycobacterium vicinigordonae]QLL05368.1 hypothetical protein H0P51_15950 [Mycobacterium vicinigordonae]